MKYLQNVTNLEQLSFWDEYIRTHAKKNINHIDYDDIVNEMYLKLDRLMKKGTVVNWGYVHLTLKTINLNMIKRREHFEAISDTIAYEEDTDVQKDTLIDLIALIKSQLSDDDIEIWTYYKMNSLKATSEKYGVEEGQLTYRLRVIREKIKELNKQKPRD